MRRLLVLAIATVLVAGCSSGDGSSGVGSNGSRSPAPRSAGYYAPTTDRGYDVAHYALRIRYTPSGPAIRASATIRATARTRLRSFDLDLRGLTVDSVRVGGRPARFSRRDGELVVRPAEALTSGSEFATKVEYHGVPRPVPDPTEADPTEGPSLGWNRRRNGDIHVASEPTGARTWFPGNDHPSDKATFTIDVDVPVAYAVASNGRGETGPVAAGRRIWRWTMDRPMATYLATVVIARMREQETASPAGVPIRNFFPTASYDASLDDFARTGEMIDWFASRFGPYPFGEYGVVTLREAIGYALETQTMSLFGADMLGTDAEAQATVAHELAHQWFGDSVGIRRWSDIWLNEGFAEYAQYLWLAHADPAFDLDRVLAELRAAHADELTPIADPGAEATFSPAVYERGALTLHALRRTVGDDTFFSILQTWTATYRYGTATTADFVRLASDVSGRDLTQFFLTWLSTPKVPPLPAGV